MTRVELNWDNNTFKAFDVDYIVQDNHFRPYTISDDCTGTFNPRVANGNYYGCTVEFDDNDLPEDWEKIEEEAGFHVRRGFFGKSCEHSDTTEN